VRALGRRRLFFGAKLEPERGARKAQVLPGTTLGSLERAQWFLGLFLYPKKTPWGFLGGPKTGVFRERGEYIPESY